MSRTVRVRNLKNYVGRGPHPMLRCLKCGSEYSAHRDDYWNADPEHAFRCCGRNMVLVVEEVSYREVALA